MKGKGSRSAVDRYIGVRCRCFDLTERFSRQPLDQRQTSQVAALMPEKVEDEVSDPPGFAHKVLEQVEAGSFRVIKGDDLSINGGVIGQLAQSFGDVGELIVKRLRVTGIQPDFASGPDADCSIAVQLQFPKPFLSLWQLRDGKAFHRLDKEALGLASEFSSGLLRERMSFKLSAFRRAELELPDPPSLEGIWYLPP